MNLLADTHVLIWWIKGSERLGPRSREAMFHRNTTLWISAVSVWEMSIKIARGRLELGAPLEETIRTLFEQGCRTLPINTLHALAIQTLPLLHGDPFDRMLVAQAQHEGLRS